MIFYGAFQHLYFVTIKKEISKRHLNFYLLSSKVLGDDFFAPSYYLRVLFKPFDAILCLFELSWQDGPKIDTVIHPWIYPWRQNLPHQPKPTQPDCLVV